MQDTLEITLPISKSKVEIRNYTTEDDDERSEYLMYLGVGAESNANQNDDGETVLKFPIANIMAARKSYVPRLVKSIDGDSSNIALRIKELRTEDYHALSEAVEKIVDEHSPKVKKGK